MSWGIWIRQRYGATSLVVGLPFMLAVLPFDNATRLYWFVIGMFSLAGFWLGRLFPRIFRRVAAIGWLLYIPLTLVLVRGYESPASLLPYVTSNLWGGLLLTALIGGIGTVLSFPIGVVLAIGRRSRYPVIRAFCVIYIELIRSVPLITVLFMAQTMLPLFLPSNINIDRVVRAITAFTLFAAAYMAENVRGGLQNVPKGQYEAAAALGLNGFLSMRLIILPQALRSIIPILTASVIGSFRDTSLVLIVGLLDLLGIAKAALAQPEFLGRHIEVYSFLAAVYWTISYAFSYIGQIIEERAGIDSQRS
jgi:general L-amino acid transport system permease protein